MIIKKFTAETMPEALRMVKQELGEDAVILQSRKVDKGGLLSFMGKQVIEVTAATPDEHVPESIRSMKLSDEKRKTLERSSSPKPGKPADDGGWTSPAQKPGPAEKLAQQAESWVEAKKPGKATAGDDSSMQSVQSELSELRDTVKDLATHLKYKNAPSLPDKLKQRWMNLVENGVGERIAHDICQKLYIELKGDELEDDTVIDPAFHEMIAARFSTGRLSSHRHENRPLVVALIGPTGVGKTTTLAKMATNRLIYGGKSVALVSTDTYRVAAVEQLQTFAGIAGVSMDVVYRPEELPKAIRRQQGKDVVLIDTAGRSQNDSGALLELKEFMDEAQADEVVLVLSAGTRVEDQKEIIRRFGIVPCSRVVLTKLDEIATPGHLLDVADLLKRQWVFLTTGQNVPDDILPADPEMLAEMMTSRAVFEEMRRDNFRVEA